jgi:hypothetical protein
MIKLYNICFLVFLSSVFSNDVSAKLDGINNSNTINATKDKTSDNESKNKNNGNDDGNTIDIDITVQPT